MNNRRLNQLGRFSLLFIIHFSLFIGLTSCLQWRYSDAELSEVFERRKQSLSIHYIHEGPRTLRYAEVHEGTNARVNVLLIHGAPSSLRVWTPYLLDDTLTRHARLYAVDRPGYGYSNFGQPDTNLVAQADFLGLIIHAHPGPWVLFGSSYGGPLATIIAANHPNRVRGILLTSPALAPGLERVYPISHFIKRPAFGWFFPSIFRVANAEKLSHKHQLDVIAPYYAQVRQPITYLYGTDDKLVYPANADYARTAFTQSPLRIVPLKGRPHFFTYTDRVTITSELMKLVKAAE